MRFTSRPATTASSPFVLEAEEASTLTSRLATSSAPCPAWIDDDTTVLASLSLIRLLLRPNEPFFFFE